MEPLAVELRLPPAVGARLDGLEEGNPLPVPGALPPKKRGVKFGRKPKLTPEQVILALRLVDEGQSVPQVADAFGVHETTIYRCLSAADAAA